MTEQRDLKALIRARMAKTGERYASARQHILQARAAPPTADDPASWHPVIETSPEEARLLLERARATVPRLTHFGLGVGGEARRRREAHQDPKAHAALEEEFRTKRAALKEHLEAIAACADWIKCQRRTVAFNRTSTSYGYKHQVEHWIDARGGPHLYIGNGSFIAAAVGLGFEYRAAAPTSPNAFFQFSRRTLRAMSANLRASSGARGTALRVVSPARI
jgi:hypothetical protein